MGREVRQVIELAFQDTLYPVDPAEDLPIEGVQLIGLDDPGQGGVDDSGGPTGLGNETVSHGISLPTRSYLLTTLAIIDSSYGVFPQGAHL